MVPGQAAFGDYNLLIYLYISPAGKEKATPLIGKCNSLSSEICVDRERGCFDRQKRREIHRLGLWSAMQRLRGSEREKRVG
jgi:hypothetical protein